MPQVVLVKGLADHLQVLVALQQRNLHAVAHPTRPFIRLPDSLVGPVVLTPTWLTPKNPHVSCPAPQQCKPRMDTLNLLIHLSRVSDRGNRPSSSACLACRRRTSASERRAGS